MADNISSSTDINTYITSSYRCLLADEFIIMNKTSSCLLDPSSPFINFKSKLFQNIYDEVKRNRELVASALKQKSSTIRLTINEIVTNTSLKKANINWKSKVAVLETLLADNQLVLAKLDETITDLTIYNEKEGVAVLAQVRESHRRICMRLRMLMTTVLNPRSASLDNNKDRD